MVTNATELVLYFEKNDKYQTDKDEHDFFFTKGKKAMVTKLLRKLRDVDLVDIPTATRAAKACMKLVWEVGDLSTNCINVRVTATRKHLWRRCKEAGIAQDATTALLATMAIPADKLKMHKARVVAKVKHRAANPFVVDRDLVAAFITTDVDDKYDLAIQLMCVSGIRFKELFTSVFTKVEDDPHAFYHGNQAKDGRQRFQYKKAVQADDADRSPPVQKPLVFDRDWDWFNNNVRMVRMMLKYSAHHRSLASKRVKQHALAWLNTEETASKAGNHLCRKIYGAECIRVNKGDLPGNFVLQEVLGHDPLDTGSALHYQNLRFA
jgi:hypothetical protein